MSEHEWEELHLLRDDPRGTGQLASEYSGIEYCPRCKRLKTAPESTFFYMRLMKDPNLKERKTRYEPPCVEAS